MSIQVQISRINGNISSAYLAAQGKGASMPSLLNSDNLSATIQSIPQGSSSGQIGDKKPGNIVHVFMSGMFRSWLIWKVGGAPNEDYYGYPPDTIFLLHMRAFEQWRWNNANVADVENSEIHLRLNTEFYGMFEPWLQNQIIEGRVPYRVGASGATIGRGKDGLLTKIILPSAHELGLDPRATVIGADFGLFTNNGSRITLDASGNTVAHHTRTPAAAATSVQRVTATGGEGTVTASTMTGTFVRPAIALSPTVRFDSNNILINS